MTDAPGWYYTEAGFLYAENEDECEVIAYEYEFEEWMMHTYDIDTDVMQTIMTMYAGLVLGGLFFAIVFCTVITIEDIKELYNESKKN